MMNPSDQNRIKKKLKTRKAENMLEERLYFIEAMRIQSAELTTEGMSYLKRTIHNDVKKLQMFRDECQLDHDILDWAKEYDFKKVDKKFYGSESDSFDSDISDEVITLLVRDDILSKRQLMDQKDFVKRF